MSPPRPRKRFGQHFLVDSAAISRIIELIGATSDEHLVEIGPGRCALTVPLAQSAGRLSVIEIDRDLAVSIANRFRESMNFSILTEDALQTNFHALGAGKPVRVVGNLPYNISTPLILALLAQSAAIVDMTFMLQKEVVDRLAAAPDTRDYGRLTVMVQSQCRVDAYFEVSPDAFLPPPKVVSKLVRITPLSDSLPAGVRAALEQCARIAFGQRRKTLGNTLGKHYERALIEASGIDLGQRPGEISVAGFVRLARAVSQAN